MAFSKTMLLLKTVIFCKRPFRKAVDGRVEGGRDDPLVLGQQVVGIFVEVGDAADPGRPGDQVIARPDQLLHQGRVGGVAFDERVSRVVLVALLHHAVFRVVVQAHHLVAVLQQLVDEIAGNESGVPVTRTFTLHSSSGTTKRR